LTREAGVYISKTLFKNLYIPRSGKVGVFTNIHFKVTKKNLGSRICCNISIIFLVTMIWSFMLLMDAKYFFFIKKLIPKLGSSFCSEVVLLYLFFYC